MKLLSTAVTSMALLAVTVIADQPLLRAGKSALLPAAVSSSNKNKGQEEYLGVTIHVTHVLQEIDATVVTNALISAYNVVHKSNGYTATSAFVERQVSIPEDVTPGGGGGIVQTIQSLIVGQSQAGPYVSKYVWAVLSYWCDSCTGQGTDGFLPPMQVLAQASSSLHTQFEEHFCSALQASGDEGLTNAAHCTIQFTYSAAKTEELQLIALQKKHKAANNNQEQDVKLGTEIHLSHVSKDQEIVYDQQVINDAFVSAYGQVHTGSDYQVNSVELLRKVDSPEDDGSDGNDDKLLKKSNVGPYAKSKYIYEYYWATMNFRCNLCGRDDDDMMLTSSTKPLELAMNELKDANKHKAFEALFCSELQRSGAGQYAKIRDCKIVYTYNNNNHAMMGSEKVMS